MQSYKMEENNNLILTKISLNISCVGVRVKKKSWNYRNSFYKIIHKTYSTIHETLKVDEKKNPCTLIAHIPFIPCYLCFALPFLYNKLLAPNLTAKKNR